MAHDNSTRPQSIEDTSMFEQPAVCRKESFERDRQSEQNNTVSDTHITERKTVDFPVNLSANNSPDATSISKTNKMSKLQQPVKNNIIKKGENNKFSEFDEQETDSLNSNIIGIKSEKEHCSEPLLFKTFLSSQASKVSGADFIRTQTEGLFQEDIPHGELSPMSSRGLYQAMLPTLNQSTDNGYVTQNFMKR